MSRYEQLLTIIDLVRPKSIVEVGTWKGRNAIAMISCAQKYHDVVEYIGYDLFEDATAETDASEFNVKAHPTMDGAFRKIKKYCPKAKINLIKGNTRDTLKSVVADLAFIDGGHSIETIINDYNALKESKTIVFDDYYGSDVAGNCPDINTVGCNYIMDKIPHIILPQTDNLKDGGLNQMVMVIGGNIG